MGNEAVNINPPKGLDIHITNHGSDWYWAAFGLFGLFTLLHLGGAYKLRPANERIFYFNSVASLFFLAITYFTLASDLGWTGVTAEFHHADKDYDTSYGVRQIFYARYIGWFLAFPPLLSNLAVLANIPWPTAMFTILVQEVFVVSLLIGSLVHSTYKWGYFVFAVVAYFIVAFNLIFTYRKTALRLEGAVFTGFQSTASGFVFLTLLYPVCWGLSEGGNVIQPDSEAAFYGVLDVLLFLVLPSVFHFFTKKLDFAASGIALHDKHGLFHEKDNSLERVSTNAPNVSAPTNNNNNEQAQV